MTTAAQRAGGHPGRPAAKADGAAAESAAARALERAGYVILARNLRTPLGEVDLVAARRGRIAFVEVKARRPGGSAGTAEAALTPAKFRRVAAAAEAILGARGIAAAAREFLGVAVDLAPDGAPGAVRIVPVEEIP